VEGLGVFPSRATAGVALKTLAALAIGGGWAALGHGLLAGPHVERVYDDLEAGGRFALNMTVFWPFLLVSIAVVAVAGLSLFPRIWLIAPLAIAAALTVAGVVLALRSDVLTAAQPLLERDALVALLLALAAWPLMAGAWLLREAHPQTATAGP
jgi:hypothetical protein